MTANEALSVADVIETLRREVVDLRKENQKLKTRCVSSEETWRTFREVLGVPEGQSVIPKIEALMRLERLEDK